MIKALCYQNIVKYSSIFNIGICLYHRFKGNTGHMRALCIHLRKKKIKKIIPRLNILELNRV